MKPKYLEFCGINSFSRKAEIDFEQLLSSGIFGIFGDTGSGKTTILDSMIFALYGRIDRLKVGSGSEVINYNCDKAYVRFDFETETAQGRKVYRVEREIKRKNSAQSLTLSELNGEQIKPISEGVKNTNAKIQEIVGLSFDDFKKCIALPQGEFAQFVKSDRSDRLQLISRLFGLEKYGDQLSAKLREKRAEAKSALDTKEGELLAYGELDSAAIKAMQAEIASLKEQKNALDAEYLQFGAEFERLKSDYSRGKTLQEYRAKQERLSAMRAEMDELRRLLRLAPAAEEICTLAKREKSRAGEIAAQTEKQRAELQRKKDAEEEILRAEKERDDAKFAERTEELSAKLAALEYIKKDAEILRGKTAERERLKKDYQASQAKKESAERELAKVGQHAEEVSKRLEMSGDTDLSAFLAQNFDSALLNAEYVGLNKYFSEKREELNRRFPPEGELFQWIDGEFAERAKHYGELSSGEKTDDAAVLFEKFRARQRELGELNASLNKLAAERARLESSVREYAGQTEQIVERGRALKEEIAQTQERIRAALGEDAVSDLTDSERKLRAQRDELAAKQQALEKRLSDMRERIRQSELSAGRAESAAAQLKKESESDAVRMQRLLGETEFSSPSQAEAILQKLSDKDAANKRVKEYDDTLVSLRANMELLLKDGEIRPVSEEEYTKRSAEFAALTEKKQSAAESLAVCEQRLTEAVRRLDLKKALERERDLRRAEYDRIAKLNELVKGNKFMEFVASEYLSDISAAATTTLLRLTGGRYFVRYEQGFYVGDNLCGGELRSVNTLSGGETFLVSLSLALALSSAIYAKSLKPIEFFFLDEGFGTLDEKLIDTVMDSLEKLKNSRFSIGLISHVEELKHRIGTKVIVTGAAESGSSQIQISY